MSGVVVRTVEELKAAQKSRAHPTIFIEGELAGNLLAAGILTSSTVEHDRSVHVPASPNPLRSSPIVSVIEVLQQLSRCHRLEVLDGDQGPRIKIYPFSAVRRESN